MLALPAASPNQVFKEPNCLLCLVKPVCLHKITFQHFPELLELTNLKLSFVKSDLPTFTDLSPTLTTEPAAYEYLLL